MRKRQRATLIMMQLAILLLILVQPALSKTAVKVWAVDLSKDQDFRRRLQVPEVLLNPPTIDFLDDNQIIVSFEDDDPMRPDPDRAPFGFHVLQVEAKA